MTDANTKKVVLVVDDAPANLAILTEILKSTYQVRAAKSGVLALKIAHAPRPPDVILLDVEMPEMDGYEVCEKLKADETTRSIPVLFVTGHTQAEQEAKGMALGAVGYISKPVEPAVVLAKMAQALI
jgi:CheY-like chemotaxis protein